MEFEQIVSSNLESAAFDAQTGAIVVRFQSGSAYRYPNCDRALWEKFRATFDGKKSSASKFMAANLKPRAYERIDDWK